MALPVNERLYEKASKSIAGGVNSPVRAFNAVGSKPLFIDKAYGSAIYDTDGNKYIDYLMSWGAVILGHAHPAICDAIAEAARRGSSYGLSTRLECELAELIKKTFPSIELLRMVNSGTEAVMSAVRLARAYTGRNKILKFEGCYHGHSDGLLAKAGSGVTFLAIPDSAGVPPAITDETLVAHYNDIEAVQTISKKYDKEIACIIVEPVAANMGVVPPAKGFLKALRNISDAIGAVLIFDEVITGFRIALGGAQEKYGIEADLTTLGKIIGGGLPVGAFGGKGEIMEYLAPQGPVYQAGTLSGNPVVASASIAVLTRLLEVNPYGQLDQQAAKLERGFREAFRTNAVPVQINRIASMFTVFFSEAPVYNYDSAKQASCLMYASFFQHMLNAGVLFPPSQFEAGFVSMAHSNEDIHKTIESVRIFSGWLE